MIPEKRKRVGPVHGGNKTPEREQLAATQSEVHWFDDGNIILQAGSKLFKVHRGILSKHSNVFQDMFCLPQPPDQPTSTAGREGCPLVVLADSEQDVHHFLDVIYSPAYNLQQSQPFAVISAMIRLGHKYEALSIRDGALAALQAEFPQDINKWSAVGDDFHLIEYYPGLLIDILNFAQELRLFTIMPTVYLAICKACTLNELTHGVRRPDGSTAELSPQDKLTCASGFILLQKAEKEKSFKWMMELPYPACNRMPVPGYNRSDSHCARGGQRIFYDLFYHVNSDDSESESVKPANCFEHWREQWEDRLCTHCVKAAKETHKTGCHELWKYLPTAFGLGNWKSLVNFI